MQSLAVACSACSRSRKLERDKAEMAKEAQFT